jgi:hypothetical protein
MMYFRASGKDGWNGYAGCGDPRPQFYINNRDLLRRVLEKETELRLSQGWQDEYSKHDSLPWAFEVTERLQKAALSACGVAPTEYSLASLQSSRSYLLNDKTMQISIPQRFDVSRRGNLYRGSLAPDVSLHHLDGTAVPMMALLASMQSFPKPLPVLILAGSVS